MACHSHSIDKIMSRSLNVLVSLTLKVNTKINVTACLSLLIYFFSYLTCNLFYFKALNVHMYIWVPHAYVVSSKDGTGYWIWGNLRYVWDTMWRLGTELRSSTRAVSAHKSWATCSGFLLIFLFLLQLQ